MAALDRVRGVPAAVVVGLGAAVISSGRLWLGNHSALTEVIWAEDGVFPLCIEKAGFFTCLTDPFAGYLLLLPRLLAGVVSMFPVASWALVTNVLAALFGGLVCGFSFAWARRFGAGWVAALAIGLLSVLAPVVGFEAINALGSSYMLLLYVSTLVLVMPRAADEKAATGWGWLGIAAVAALLLVTSLTIPTAGVFLALIAVQLARRAINLRAAITWAAAIVLGLFAQLLTAINAAKPRAIEASADSFGTWLGSLPDTVLTYWPGMRLGDYDFVGVFPVVASPLSGTLVALAFVVGGILLVVRGQDRNVAIGLLLLTGVVVGAVPTIIGGPNNRYFVVPALLWGAAAMLALDPVIRRARWWVVALVVALVAVIWWPMIPARPFRADPTPPWTDEVARVEAKCQADPAATERLIFSPYWPPNWGDGLAEPTHPDIPCLVVWKWR